MPHTLHCGEGPAQPLLLPTQGRCGSRCTNAPSPQPRTWHTARLDLIWLHGTLWWGRRANARRNDARDPRGRRTRPSPRRIGRVLPRTVHTPELPRFLGGSSPRSGTCGVWCSAVSLARAARGTSATLAPGGCSSRSSTGTTVVVNRGAAWFPLGASARHCCRVGLARPLLGVHPWPRPMQLPQPEGVLWLAPVLGRVPRPLGARGACLATRRRRAQAGPCEWFRRQRSAPSLADAVPHEHTPHHLQPTPPNRARRVTRHFIVNYAPA